MYKIGQKRLSGVSYDEIAVSTFAVNKIYYLKLSKELDEGQTIGLYNLDNDKQPDTTTSQIIKPDYFDKTLYIFTPLDNFAFIKLNTNGKWQDINTSVYELKNELTQVCEKVGIQDRPTSLYVINGELFRIGYNGLLEVDNEVKVLSVSKLQQTENAILDYMYKEE